MNISNRLYQIYKQVDNGASVADIGTDHGYVPILLLQNNVSPFVIMSDISNKSLDKAISNFDLNCNSDQGYFRVGNGLNTILSFEVDEIIIAGIGGQLITDILQNDLEKTRTFKKFILQPRNNSGKLRYWLNKNNFKIEREVLAPEGKFVCEIIVTRPKNGQDHLSPNSNYSPDDIRWEFPETFKECDPVLLRRKIEWKINSLTEEINNLRRSKSDKSSLIKKLRKDKIYIKSLMIQQNNML